MSKRPKTTPPSSNRHSAHEALKQKILSVYQQLPENQKRVATAVLQRSAELPFLTTDLLAKKLEVSKATIVRFAQRLGYEGFTELQSEMTGALQMDLSDVNRVFGTIEREMKNETLARVAAADVENINETVQHLDRQLFSSVVDQLAGARRVYTMGAGVSSLLAQVLAYELNQVAVDARALSAGHVRFVEMLALAGPTDVVVAFSFPPYTKETVDAATFARKRKVPVIAITDSMTAPLTFHSTSVVE
jgi:DNA-binding MurR/RpiR family transcriptional regulator